MLKRVSFDGPAGLFVKIAVLSCAFAIFFIIGLYIVAFSHYPLSDNPADWSQTAQYFGGMLFAPVGIATITLLVSTVYHESIIVKNQQQELAHSESQANANVLREEIMHLSRVTDHELDKVRRFVFFTAVSGNAEYVENRSFKEAIYLSLDEQALIIVHGNCIREDGTFSASPFGSPVQHEFHGFIAKNQNSEIHSLMAFTEAVIDACHRCAETRSNLNIAKASLKRYNPIYKKLLTSITNSPFVDADFPGDPFWGDKVLEYIELQIEHRNRV